MEKDMTLIAQGQKSYDSVLRQEKQEMLELLEYAK